MLKPVTKPLDMRGFYVVCQFGIAVFSIIEGSRLELLDMF